MKFSELDFQRHKFAYDGIQAIRFFPNGYGLSVVKHMYSYGYDDGLYEAAVLKGVDGDYELCYDTPVADDIIGYQSEDQIELLLNQIESL
jgi:hypothetical protein